MLRGALEPWHIIIIVALLFVLFGAKRMPDASRSLARSLKIFKSEVKDLRSDDEPETPEIASTTAGIPQQSATGATATTVAATPATPVTPAATTTAAAAAANEAELRDAELRLAEARVNALRAAQAQQPEHDRV